MSLANIITAIVMLLMISAIVVNVFAVNKNYLEVSNEAVKRNYEKAVKDISADISFENAVYFSPPNATLINITNQGTFHLELSLLSFYVDGEKILSDNITIKNIRDLVNPGLWDPGETIQINLTKNLTDGNHTLVIFTEEGTSTEGIIERLGEQITLYTYNLIVNVTNSTGECAFAHGSIAEYANTSDNTRSLISKGPTTCGWYVQDLDIINFSSFTVIVVSVEHIEEKGGVAPTLSIGNLTDSTKHGTTALSLFEWSGNGKLEDQQGVGLTEEGTDNYTVATLPVNVGEFNNLTVRVTNTDSANPEDLVGVDHIYLNVTYQTTS